MEKDKVLACALRAIYHIEKRNYQMALRYLKQIVKFLKEE